MKSESLPLSVVIPTHNGRESIRDAVSSVLAQSHPEFELLVVCDGDGARTRALLAEFTDERLHVMEQSHSGVSAARNSGAAASRHAWIAFLDDDDMARPNWLASLAAGVNDDLVGFVTAELAFWEGNQLVEVRKCGLSTADLTMEASTILPGGFAVRRDVFDRVGGFDESLSYSENQDLGLRILDHPNAPKRVVHVPEVVVDFRREAARRRASRYKSAPADSARIFLGRYAKRIAEEPRSDAALNRIISRDDRVNHRAVSAVRRASRAVLREPLNPANTKSLILAVATLPAGAFHRLATVSPRVAGRRTAPPRNSSS